MMKPSLRQPLIAMKTPLLLPLGLLVIGSLLMPTAYAQDTRPTDVLLRLDGDVHVVAADTATATAVINGNATVDGVVREGLLVVNGRALVRGTVNGPVVVANGHLELGPEAQVGDDVVLFRSTLTRAPGATVGGEVVDERGFSLGPGAAWFFWLSVTFAVLVSGLAFVFLFGGRPGSVEAALVRPGPVALAALGLVVALPVVAVLSFMTGIGVVLGFGLLLAAIPLLWFVGYLVSGLALGHLMLTRFRPDETPNPYAAAVLGLGLLQVLLAIPFIGGLALLAGPYGAGAGLYAAWTQRQNVPSTPVEATTPLAPA